MKPLWPVWVAVGGPLLLVALNATPIGMNFVFVMIGIPALLFMWGGLGVWALLLTVRGVQHRDLVRVGSNAVLPLVILAASIWHWQFLHLCNDGGDIAYFLARHSSFAQAVRATQPSGEPQLLIFNRGGMSWASRGYVYDESDEITLDEPLRSAQWKARSDGTELTCGYYAQPFPGHSSITQHWYLASFSC